MVLNNVVVLVYWHNIKLVKWGWFTLISDRNANDSQTTRSFVFFYKICFNIQITHGCSVVRTKLYHWTFFWYIESVPMYSRLINSIYLIVKIVSFTLFLKWLHNKFFSAYTSIRKTFTEKKKKIVITLRNTAYIFSFEVYRLINMWGE